MRIKNLAKQVKASAKKKEKPKKKKQPMLSTGSALLNLACSGEARGALFPGTMSNPIGDSHTGKTILAHNIFAEAALHPVFKHYDFYYDNIEAAPTKGIRRIFGKLLKGILKAPTKDKETGKGICSSLIQDWKTNVWRIIKTGRPFIYVTDSADGLNTKESIKKLDDAVAGKKEEGSYGMEKSKAFSEVLGPICREIEKTSSILIILSQTRDDINPFTFTKKTRSGGRALKFYACIEMWLAHVGIIKDNKTKRNTGHKVRIKVSKSKITGKVREINLSIYPNYGIDDIGSCVDFLIDEGFWQKEKLKYRASALGLFATKEKIIAVIDESDDLKQELINDTERAWNKIEESLKLKRKPRY